jgi:hypothetical protein
VDRDRGGLERVVRGNGGRGRWFCFVFARWVAADGDERERRVGGERERERARERKRWFDVFLEIW